MLNRKVILLTGGTGSFGYRFTDIVLRRYRPKKLIIFSRDELKQFEMQQRFPLNRHPNLRFFIGDVRDAERLHRALDGVDIVIHAAAMKQVPACEYNPFEAIKTNILGAKNIIDVSIERKVKKVIALSTDKAVSPANLYGASKLCAEKLFVQGNFYAGSGQTRFNCVRYGNVIGSRGSVVPLYFEQKSDGVLTVTDQRMTRFWITLDQGVQTVLDSIKLTQGGEIVVPIIPSMKIIDLAKTIGPKCKIRVTGIRPGEKLHESLVSTEEGRNTRRYRSYYLIYPELSLGWSRRMNRKGIKVPDGFAYTSDANQEWLNVHRLKKMLLQFDHKL